MNKVLISGYYGYKNFGDEAVLKVLTDHLKSLNAEITVISSDMEYTEETYGVKSVRNFDFKSVIKAVKETDILISGGGSLFQDVTSFKSLVYYSLIIALAIIFNKKIIIFAQGIGPLNKKISKIIVKNLLKYCEYISVRDENSMNLLKSWDIDAELVSDPVFSLDFQKQTKTDNVGVQLRDFKTVNYNLLNKLVMLINAKFSDRKIQIFSLQKELDLGIAHKFENLLKQINPRIQTEIISDNIAENISRLEYLFGMRYHAIVIALMSGVKTCAINYDIKVEKLAKDANLPVISMDADENFEKIYKELENIDANSIQEFASKKIFNWTEFDKSFFIK